MNTICRAQRCVCRDGYTKTTGSSTTTGADDTNNICIEIRAINDGHNHSTNNTGTGDEVVSGVGGTADDDNKPKEKSNGSHMLPIMIVLGIMFIGMCVALNLFSRARFRESRSGIFAKPRLIKFNNNTTTSGGGGGGSGKKRRTSPPGANIMVDTTGQGGDDDNGQGGSGIGGGVGVGGLPKNGAYVSVALE
ncbi:uncharacterized protein LOC128955010 [Oppia nitens]|uniref:uncharacterized protein LOC128955010 n=1 Tax=Oppia nitens TaxID=1686743 RepID=UPI0023DCC9D1|nr:uncharacterized protein LOC128955010 [Oppia nitens]